MVQLKFTIFPYSSIFLCKKSTVKFYSQSTGSLHRILPESCELRRLLRTAMQHIPVILLWTPDSVFTTVFLLSLSQKLNNTHAIKTSNFKFLPYCIGVPSLTEQKPNNQLFTNFPSPEFWWHFFKNFFFPVSFTGKLQGFFYLCLLL